MSYVPYAGACLLIPFNDAPHLFIVLNDPCKDEQCLLAMLSSVKAGKHHDKSCVLDKGDHDFIKAPTYVVYRLANTVSAKHIGSMVDKKLYVEKEAVKDEIFIKVIKGLYASDETRPFAIAYARKNGI